MKNEQAIHLPKSSATSVFRSDPDEENEQNVTEFIWQKTDLTMTHWRGEQIDGPRDKFLGDRYL